MGRVKSSRTMEPTFASTSINPDPSGSAVKKKKINVNNFRVIHRTQILIFRRNETLGDRNKLQQMYEA